MHQQLHRVPGQLPSYPQRLHDAGYKTAYIGKWHMGEGNDEQRPGFDYWASHKGQGQYYDTEFNINGKRQVIKGYYAHVVTEPGDRVAEDGAAAVLAEVGHKAPHGFWIPEPKYAHAFDNVTIDEAGDRSAWPRHARLGQPSASRRGTASTGRSTASKDFDTFVRTYHETILSVDDSVGAMYEALRAMGELDNTIFVFAGDNGFLLGEHASIDKRTMWEESIRIPLLVRYPDAMRDAARRRSDGPQPGSGAERAGLVRRRPLPAVHGASFKGLGQGRDVAWRNSWLYEYNFENEFPYTPNVRGVRTDEWRYIHYPNGEGQPDTEKAELYNIKTDPLEKHNLIDAPEAQGTLTSLKAELQRIQQQTGGLPDRMPVNPKLEFQLPDAAIR